MTTEAEDINGILEIIETYWNVNLIMTITTASSGEGNNRNILECKSAIPHSRFSDKLRQDRKIHHKNPVLNISSFLLLIVCPMYKSVSSSVSSAHQTVYKNRFLNQKP